MCVCVSLSVCLSDSSVCSHMSMCNVEAGLYEGQIVEWEW